MKNKPLTAFDWFLIICTLVITLAVIGDALKRVMSDFQASQVPVVQHTVNNAATGRISRPKLVI